MNNTSKLISKLAEDLKPVKVMQHPAVRAAKWLAIGLLYIIIFPVFMGIRFDIEKKITEPFFILELIIAPLGSVLACLSAAYLSVPDCYQKSYIKWIATVPFFALIAILIFQLIQQQTNVTEPINSTLNTYQCSIDMLIFAAFPAIVTILFARKGVTTNYAWSGAMISLSAINLSYITLRLIEPNDVMQHIILWHYIPMIIAVLIGIFCGCRLFKW